MSSIKEAFEQVCGDFTAAEQCFVVELLDSRGEYISNYLCHCPVEKIDECDKIDVFNETLKELHPSLRNFIIDEVCRIEDGISDSEFVGETRRLARKLLQAQVETFPHV